MITIAQVIARMEIPFDGAATALLLSESITPLPADLTITSLTALLEAEHATPTRWFVKAFRDQAIYLAMAEDLSSLATACAAPQWERKGSVRGKNRPK